MKNHRSFWHRVGNVIATSIVLGWLLSWCFRSRLGMFLLLSALGCITAVFVIGGVTNVIAWYWMNNFKYSLADEGWFWLVCYLGSAIWTLDYLLFRERKIQLPTEEDDEED